MSEDKLSFTFIMVLVFAVITIIILDKAWNSPDGNRYLFIPFLLLLVVLIAMTYAAGQKKSKSKEEEFLKKLLSARETERKKIASELHDGIQQGLHSISFEAQRLARVSPITGYNVDHIADRINETIDDIRRISSELYPHHLEKLGLKKSIQQMANNLTDSTDVYFSTSIIDEIDSLFNEEASINIYRIIQELFNNIIKHSKAAKASIIIHTDKLYFYIIVEDNGRGFEDESNKLVNIRKGLGIISIEERLKILGGRLNISTSKEKGAKFKITLPLISIYNKN
ncbi:MAG: hypothetical protein EHM58_06630 [Ignavibacteriae bacterium]|nr:MAG: hypothetical protein EHM58_06630 [Ignavibacteriota bacterium]